MLVTTSDCTSTLSVCKQGKDIFLRLEVPIFERMTQVAITVATILLSMGVHPKVVQELLGHNQISMTMDIYSHVLPTMQKDAVSKLNDALQG
jgi:site-specific recombinase XerC